MSVFAEDAMRHILDGKIEEAKEALVLEAIEDKLIKSIGEVSTLNYLMKFEEYLDDHDIYMFDGWEDAEVISRPRVDRFWVTFYVRLGLEADLNGAKRIINDKENQNKVTYRKDETSYLMCFKILRRLLDEIETTNKDKAEEIADREANTEMGL